MFRYLISLSGALALLNVVPCYALDGQWILLAFIELSLRSVISDPEIRGLIYSILLLFGIILIGTNIVILRWNITNRCVSLRVCVCVFGVCCDSIP